MRNTTFKSLLSKLNKQRMFQVRQIKSMELVEKSKFQICLRWHKNGVLKAPPLWLLDLNWKEHFFVSMSKTPQLTFFRSIYVEVHQIFKILHLLGIDNIVDLFTVILNFFEHIFKRSKGPLLRLFFITEINRGWF